MAAFVAVSKAKCAHVTYKLANSLPLFSHMITVASLGANLFTLL